MVPPLMAKAPIPLELIEAPARARRLYSSAPEMAVTETGLQILVFLVRNKGAAAVEVQEALVLEQTRVSHAVKRLYAASLLEVIPDPGDQRRRILKPTGKGRSLVSEFVGRIEPLLAQGGVVKSRRDGTELRP